MSKNTVAGGGVDGAANRLTRAYAAGKSGWLSLSGLAELTHPFIDVDDAGGSLASLFTFVHLNGRAPHADDAAVPDALHQSAVPAYRLHHQSQAFIEILQYL